MARFILNEPADAVGGAILSSASYDAGKGIWRSGSNGTWQTCFGDDNLVNLKVVRADPMFDIEYNISVDHVTTWNSQAFRLIARYGTNSNADSSSWKGPNIMTQIGTWCDSHSVCGRATGVQCLWRPSGFNLVAGNYIKFAIQRWGNTSGSNGPHLNQCTENANGTSDNGDDWQGGGFFIRVRELDPSYVTCRANQINTSTGNM